MTCEIFSRVGLLAWVLLGVAVALRVGAAEGAAEAQDALVYKDGDRVQGRLVSREGGVIVFKSERFGELRVPAADAVVIVAEKTKAVAKPAGAAKAAPTEDLAKMETKPAAALVKVAADHDEEERVRRWDRFSPWVLTARVREFFGPWHGRLALSTETVTDSSERQTSAVDATLRRKWERDEVFVNARFDYSATDRVTTTDVVKATGSWRHDFTGRQFAHYRPSLEWNRANRKAGLPADYLLLQQEIGTGFTVLNTPGRKLRTGVSQNLFDLWNAQDLAQHNSRGVQSAFEEVEWALPWRMSLAQRGVWYPVGGQADGWENRVDLNKKLTETLSTSVRHEIRRNNPDGTAQDFTRLKLLVGLDF